MIRKLNLGCGDDIKKGYINVDFEKFKGVDKIFDLNKIPYPFKEKRFEEILINNILEHLNNPYQVMKEIYRISKKNCKIYITVPHFTSDNVWGDIQHKRGFNFDTFRNKNISNMFKIKKQKIVFYKYYFLIQIFANKFPKVYERVFGYIFPASHLNIILMKR